MKFNNDSGKIKWKSKCKTRSDWNGLIWIYTVCSGLSVSVFSGNMVMQGMHRLEKSLNIQDCFEKSLKI